MPKLVEEQLKDTFDAVTELRKTVEAEGVQNKEKIEKLNAVLDKHEEVHQKMLGEAKEKENLSREIADITAMIDEIKSSKDSEKAELKQHIDTLEKVLARRGEMQGATQEEYRNEPEYKALMAFCKNGIATLSDVEHKDYLRTDSNAQGGYTVPAPLANVILKEIEEVSPVRQFARKWTTMTKSLTIPVRDSIPTAAYEKELEAGTGTTQTYKAETLTGYRQMAIVGATIDILKLSNFNIESEIMSDARDSFAVGEGNKFISGTGVKEPEGIIINSSIVSTDTTESTGSITGAGLFDDVINLQGQLKIGYNPIYFFNRSTLAFLRTAKSSAGGYLWQVGGTTMPMQIAGYDYAIFQDMPSVNTAAGTKFLGFGDLFRGYSILDSIMMSLIRDDVTQASKALVLFNIHRWNTGQVVIPEAIKLLDEKS